MRSSRLLDSLTIQSEGWTDRILALDRENMTGILEGVGIEFPIEKRLKSLVEPSTIVIALLNADHLDGYVEFRRDLNDADDIYLSSIQVRSDSRSGFTLGLLIVECAKALENCRFNRLRAGVQKSNQSAIRLYRKLGSKLMFARETIEVSTSSLNATC